MAGSDEELQLIIDREDDLMPSKRERASTEVMTTQQSKKQKRPPCATDGCNNQKKYAASGLCWTCHCKQPGKAVPLCTTDGCTAKKNHASGRCATCHSKSLGKPVKPCTGSTCPTSRVHTECPYGFNMGSSRGRYGTQCVRCFCATYPDSRQAINAKAYLHAREQTVREVLQAAFPDRRWTFDRAFSVGARQRPDARVNLSQGGEQHRTLIVEVDEDSHRTYDCRKERLREEVFDAHKAVGTEIVMVRFNPDEYTDYGGIFHASCFKYNRASGTVCVDKDRKEEWEERCNDLVAVVSNFMDPSNAVPPPEEGRAVFSCELFYDNISEQDIGTLNAARARLRRIGKKRALC